jgi:hypothetical protein
MSDTPAEKTPSTVTDFAASTPLKEDADGVIVVDFDSLAAESAKAAFTPKSDISSMFVKPEERKAPRQVRKLYYFDTHRIGILESDHAASTSYPNCCILYFI